MSWDMFAAVAEMLGAIGVIASVAYLAIQIRQSTATTRLGAAQSQERAIAEINLAIAASESLNDLLQKGLTRPEQMNGSEGQRFHMIMLQIYRAFESAHKLYRAGLLTADDWSYHLTGIENFKGFPSFQNWWEAANQYYDPAFRAVIDSAGVGAPVVYDEDLRRFVAQSLAQS